MERVPRQRSEAINTLLDLFDKYDITGPTAQMLLLLGELADLIIVPDPEDSLDFEVLTDNPLVDLAERALRNLGVVDRPDAEAALITWAHAPELTERERAAILGRFGGAQ